MLKINNIEVVYSSVILVLKGVSLEVSDGSLVALLGANGAGKSTTLKAVSGLLGTELGVVTDGNIEFDGQRIDNKNPEEIARLGIIQVLEGRRLFEQLTVEENLRAGTLIGVENKKSGLEMVYEYFPRLKALRNKTSGYVSGGEQQMVVLGRGLIARPKLMLIDEPSLGLAPKLVKEIFEILRTINEKEKTSFLLVEQNVKLALSIASYGYVMEDGRLVLDGPTAKLESNEDIREFYLGLNQVGERKSYKEVKHYRRRKRWL